eukprot:TRINITY_DN2411_c0_g1_i4.p1 TRINITY_DN2411_c0_g1~~TRINITY_DN2411_c0_g1_i4.p1  ORF type:complete len:553 (-),score=47.66 TRINITY_DN2411_c0_g1_i4:1444-3102(-)
MDRLDSDVSSRGNRRAKQGHMPEGKGTEKGDQHRKNQATSSRTKNIGNTFGRYLREVQRFWYEYSVSPVQMRIFRLFFFLVFAVDSFERISRGFRFVLPNQPLFLLPHIPYIFSYLPLPTCEVVTFCWIASFFLSIRVAFGLGSRVEVISLMVFRGYTTFVSQTDNYQHHYLVFLILVILSTVDWSQFDAAKGTKIVNSWQIKLLLFQVSLVYFWTGITKVNVDWLKGEIMPLTVGPDFSEFISTYSSWALLSISTVAIEFLLCVLFQIRKYHTLAFVLGFPMHVLMGISGLQIGRFSEVILCIYIFLAPPSILVFIDQILFKVKSSVPAFVFKEDNFKILGSSFGHCIGYFILHAYNLTEYLPSLKYIAAFLTSIDLINIFLLKGESRKIYPSFTHVLSTVFLVYLCFHTVHLRDMYSHAGVTQVPNKNIDSAIYFYRKAIEIDPTYLEGYGDLGLFLEDKGNLDEALQIYTKVLSELDDQNLKSLIGTVRVYHQKQDRRRVCHFIEKTGPIAFKRTQVQCVNQQCSQLNSHANYVLNILRKLDTKWECKQ